MLQVTTRDWAGLDYYTAANAALPQRKPREKRTVFFGDSITEFWDLAKFFPGCRYINRGIAGQTTSQMLIRLRQDVIDIGATRCVILGGTNDLAGNSGRTSVQEIAGYLANLCAVAHENNVEIFLASVLPVGDDGVHPNERGYSVMTAVARAAL